MALTLDALGFGASFKIQLNNLQTEGMSCARITSVHRDSYEIHNGTHLLRAELSGKLMFQAESSLDYPAVGDWVIIQLFDNESMGIIHEILPRKTLLKRKSSGKKVDFQLIAANIDTALIMQSLDENFNPNRLERYLVMVREGGIEPVVLLSKTDLLSEDELSRKMDLIRQTGDHIPVIPFSNYIESDLEKVETILHPAKTYCLLGSSGVGKTSLLNRLLGDELYSVQSIREKDGRGRHTTTRRQLIILKNGALMIDTPGMRELGNFDMETGLEETFDEIASLASRCRFNDCTHTHETGCAVLKSIEAGDISESRYNNYIKMQKESAHLSRSYLEKRQRDKAFGKMVKEVKKHLKTNQKGKYDG